MIDTQEPPVNKSLYDFLNGQQIQLPGDINLTSFDDFNKSVKSNICEASRTVSNFSSAII